MKIKRPVMLCIIISVLLSGITAPGISPEAGAEVWIDPWIVEAMPGETTAVTVKASNLENLQSWQVVLKYNAMVANCTGTWIPEDNVFEDMIWFNPDPIINDPTVDGFNYMVMGGTSLSDAVNVSVGILFKLNFTILQLGQSRLLIATKQNPVQYGVNTDLWYSVLVDPDMREISFTESSGDIMTGPAATLTIVATSGGTTDPAPGVYAFPANSTVSITAVPESGYDLDHWELDTANVGSQNPYSMTMSKNHTIHAVFVIHTPVEWTVDDNGPADFHRIQDAIDSPNVTYGDIILVKSGIYYEHVSVTKKLALRGVNWDTTIIDGNGYRSAVMLDDSASITGFTIRNGGYGVSIRSWSSSTIATNCTIKGNRIIGNRYGGVSLFHCQNNTVSDNIIAENPLFGVYLYDLACNNTIINNTVTENEHGIAFNGGSHGNILRDNKMIQNKYNFGLIVLGSTNFVSYPDLVANDVDASNTVDGKPIFCWVDRHNEQVPQDAGYVWLTSCTNITVRGLNLTNNLQGILLLCSNNTIVADNSVAYNAYGIYTLAFSYNNTIINNTVRDNTVFGIFLSQLSMFTTMRDNEISGSQMNFGLFPKVGKTGLFTYPPDLINDVDTSNTVEGNPIVYWTNQHDRQVPKNAGYVALVNCSDIVVEGLSLSNNVQNILVLSTNNTVITNNTIANSVYGVDVRDVSFYSGTYPNVTGFNHFDSFNTTVSGNILVDNVVGISIRSNQSIVSENTLYRNMLGICLQNTCNSTISKNVLYACIDLMSGRLSGSLPYELQYFYYPEDPRYYSTEGYNLELGGIVIGGSYNIVCNNTVMNSGIIGISTYDMVRALSGHNNTIFHNNFISNAPFQAEDFAGINSWDNGYPSGGNYWSDYVGVDIYSGPDQNESGSDGIGDTPYKVPNIRPSGNASEDHYPLMNQIPWASKLSSSIKVGVKSDDWIKYDCKVSGSPSATSLAQWMKVELLTVEGTAADARVTVHMSNGTEQSQTMAVDFIAGNGTLGTFSGLVIPAESATSDFAYLSGVGGNVMILGETTRIYGGARRTVVQTSLRINYIQFTCHWDKQTGILVEASAASDLMNSSVLRASETNMWQPQANLTDLNDDRIVNLADIGIAVRSIRTKEGDSKYNPIADLDGNGEINIVDISKIAREFGKEWTGQTGI